MMLLLLLSVTESFTQLLLSLGSIPLCWFLPYRTAAAAYGAAAAADGNGAHYCC
jgi:hypothetical protein